MKLPRDVAGRHLAELLVRRYSYRSYVSGAVILFFRLGIRHRTGSSFRITGTCESEHLAQYSER